VTQLYTHEELPSWTHSGNKLVLIGDAAHAMTPYLAQGAAMGIEDSAILGGILSQPEYCTPETLPQASKLYESLRIKRAAMVAENSITSRYFTQMEDGQKQVERDEWLLAHPGICEGHINIRSRKEFLDELFGYDAYKALASALAQERAKSDAVEAKVAQVNGTGVLA
jgi:salicylate hydroxylase